MYMARVDFAVFEVPSPLNFYGLLLLEACSGEILLQSSDLQLTAASLSNMFIE